MVTIVFFPINFDALIIPKISLLFISALYFLPSIFAYRKEINKSNYIKILTYILILIIAQLVFSLLMSDAPFAQQIYGRTGRGLGLITQFSLAVFTLISAILIKKDQIKLVLFGIIFSSTISSFYSVIQYFNLDLLEWDSKTNGIIGTLGNPNYQSSFAAMALVPALMYFWGERSKYIYSVLIACLLFFTIYISESTQGYVNLAASLLFLVFIFSWFRIRKLSYLLGSISIFASVLAIAGTLNMGPLAKFLYKVSIQSRGDFWRSAFDMANSNPLFGVGIDSFYDYFLLYRDQTAVNHTFAEMTDNAHNYFLQYASTTGYPLAFLHILLIILCIYSSILLIRRNSKFDGKIAALYCAWIVFQLQAIISPGNISLMLWGAILTGVIISVNSREINQDTDLSMTRLNNKYKSILFKYSLVLFGFLSMLPLFNNDRELLTGLKNGNGDQVITALKSFPESSANYNQFGLEILRSNLPIQALDIAFSAVKFNPNSAAAWGLILINPAASVEDRIRAKEKILQLDPLNTEISKFSF